jgi:hypothetical protein
MLFFCLIQWNGVTAQWGREKWKPFKNPFRLFTLLFGTLFENENERQRTEPVPIPLPRAAGGCFEAKKRIFFSANLGLPRLSNLSVLRCTWIGWINLKKILGI